ncbi:uncharacterized protein J4E79_004197 [Alternaria viburni]|uniref:uncharacterized protein n=1 Tax=Alternaria viburni TaxID=566460 RepID=UPI0020C308BE|nr:uncharacterized protein J4E79_004197 [Alternaria viburni]KAI4662886.1 hypothetical protein J4E79_004197 [Alternaria viburni]
MSVVGHELHPISNTTTSSSSFGSDYDRRRRENQRRDFQSSDAFTTQPRSINASSHPIDDVVFENYPLLLCLQLIAHYNVFVFSVIRGRKWNTRERLGRGTTFDVEQADLPVGEAVSDLQYYDISKGLRHGFITDHTGIRWGYDTVVAYKSLTLNARAPQHFYQTSPLRDIPFFDLMHQYFGLVDMSYIPNQVMKALTELETSNSAGNKAEIHFQLGLCHAVGFGVASDYEHAIRLISSSAEGGFWKARLLLRSVAAALGVALDPGIEHLSLTWTNDNLELSSLDASRRLLTQSRSHDSVSTASERRLLKSNVTSISGDTSIMPLIAAIKLGQLPEIRALVQDCENVNLPLDDGETALHYAVLTLNSSIIAILVQAEADVLQCTTGDCELPISGSAVYRIPSNVSPASLTVLLDRVDLLKGLLEPRIGQQSEPRKEETLVNLLAWGARYQSIDCVSYLCEQLRSKPERPFDDLGVNPLSYAVRADFLFRIALFTPHIDRTDGDVTPAY